MMFKYEKITNKVYQNFEQKLYESDYNKFVHVKPSALSNEIPIKLKGTTECVLTTK